MSDTELNLLLVTKLTPGLDLLVLGGLLVAVCAGVLGKSHRTHSSYSTFATLFQDPQYGPPPDPTGSHVPWAFLFSLVAVHRVVQIWGQWEEPCVPWPRP